MLQPCKHGVEILKNPETDQASFAKQVVLRHHFETGKYRKLKRAGHQPYSYEQAPMGMDACNPGRAQENHNTLFL
jgi:hypothetical protein